ncbi:MAG: DUF3833 domain-containing protein [Gammaproteobacteria bacterium]
MFRIFIAATVIALAGCSAAPVEDYAGNTPRLDLTEYFNGPLTGWGIVQDRNGNLSRSFRVDMVGRWEGDQGVLDEDFYWSDGEFQERTWRFNRVDEHTYTGTAGDVVGEATGKAYGNVLRWSYVLELDLDGDKVEVTLDDWMYLVEEDVLVNRSQIRKFGIHFGDVIIFFHKGVPPRGR